MEYIILTGTADELSEKVNEKLAKGWTLHGLTFKLRENEQPDLNDYPPRRWFHDRFAQAMIKVNK